VAARGVLGRSFRLLGRIRVRLLIVNVVVVLVPIVGLEFARLYERRALGALERDMRNQAVLVRSMLREDLEHGRTLGDEPQIRVLTSAAVNTRTRVRVLDVRGAVVADSHANGPPEGLEPGGSLLSRDISMLTYDGARRTVRRSWPIVATRPEVQAALRGKPGSYTRVSRDPPAVYLFVSEPVRHQGQVIGAVYVVRSTRPVLDDLYRIRTGLTKVLGVALVITLLITLLLAWSISRPLIRLSKVAQRIAAGEPNVEVPLTGSGEIRELADALRKMKEELEARARYFSDFAADVAHEFKSPLTAIRGAAELLGEGAADDPAARQRFLHNIGLDVQRLDRLVTRLLVLSRIEGSSEVASTGDLEALLREVVARVLTEDRPVVLAYEANTRFIPMRLSDLENALVNVLENAVRFTSSGQAVIVKVSEVAHRIQVEVTDRGPGISPADLPRIFDRFFTTDTDRNGTGLGLAIVRAVATAHGGSVRAESSENGTTITLSLPTTLEHRTV